MRCVGTLGVRSQSSFLGRTSKSGSLPGWGGSWPQQPATAPSGYMCADSGRRGPICGHACCLPRKGRHGVPREPLSPNRPLTHIPHLIHTQQIDRHPTHCISTSQVGLLVFMACFVMCRHVRTCTHARTHYSHIVSPPFTPFLHNLTPIPSSTLFTGTHTCSPTCTHHVYKHRTSLLPPTSHRHSWGSRSSRGSIAGPLGSSARMPAHLHMHVVHMQVCICEPLDT